MRMTEKGGYSLTTGDSSLSIFGQPFPFSSHHIRAQWWAKNFLIKSPNEFALKAGIEYLNEIRLSEGETQESIMSSKCSK